MSWSLRFDINHHHSTLTINYVSDNKCSNLFILNTQSLIFRNDKLIGEREGLTLLLVVVVSAFDSAPSLANTEVRFKPFIRAGKTTFFKI